MNRVEIAAGLMPELMRQRGLVLTDDFVKTLATTALELADVLLGMSPNRAPGPTGYTDAKPARGLVRRVTYAIKLTSKAEGSRTLFTGPSGVPTLFNTHGGVHSFIEASHWKDDVIPTAIMVAITEVL